MRTVMQLEIIPSDCMGLTKAKAFKIQQIIADAIEESEFKNQLSIRIEEFDEPKSVEEEDDLNSNERAVFEAAKEVYNGEFGFGEDIVIPGLSKQQIGGYLSSLEKKGYLEFSTDGLKKCFHGLKEEKSPEFPVRSRVESKLREFRRDEAMKRNLPAYIILTERALNNITGQLPETTESLRDIIGIGPTTIQLYGSRILEIIEEEVE